MKRFSAALVFVFMSVTATVNAEEHPWELAQQAEQRDQVSTWTRKVDGFTLKAFKGQIEVPYSMLVVMAVIADVERFPEWVFQCDYARLMSEIDNNVAYVHIKGIWPVSDRDVVTETIATQNPDTLAITLKTEATGGLYPPQEGKVRIPALDNVFLLEPLENGWTRLTFDTFVDPGGFIPGWLANLVAIRAPRDTLVGMYRLMADPKYHIASTDDLPETFPVWRSMTFPNAGKSAALAEQRASE